MLTGKEKRELRAKANTLKACFQIGKDGISFNQVDGISKALKANELVKVSLLKTSPVDAKAAALEVAEATGSELVQVIGKTFVLYKEKED